MRCNRLSVSFAPLIIQLALPIFIVEHVLLVPGHHIVVLLATHVDVIGKLAVLVRNLDLSLQALLLIVELTKAVLQHLSLIINKKTAQLIETIRKVRDMILTSICFCFSCSFSWNLPEPCNPVVLFIPCGLFRFPRLMLPKPK